MHDSPSVTHARLPTQPRCTTPLLSDWLCDFSTGQEMAWRKPEDTWEPEHQAAEDDLALLTDGNDALVDNGDGTFSMRVMTESERERNM